ncbi:MAG: hypothetical protein RJA33_810 [Actinomycetota bacterium]
MSTPIKKAKSTGRPARPLALLALIIVGLIATSLLSGAKEIRLGLDLRGGTSVTLTPRTPVDGTAITNEAIDQAVEIIRQRVNSLGVAESEVRKEASSGGVTNVVVSMPGASGDELIEIVGQTAELRFRQVLATGAGVAGSGSDSASPVPGISDLANIQFAALDCSLEENRSVGANAPAEQSTLACAEDGTTKYILAPAEVLGRQVDKAEYGMDSQSGTQYIVSLTFNGEGTKAFGDLTARVTSLPSPQNQVAIVLDGVVISAPSINEAIPGGSAQITGNFTQVEAANLANVLKYGALPLTFDLGEVLQVSPTLGSEQLDAGLLAGALGLLLVVLFSLIYYRALGLVTVGSLAVAGAILYLVFLVLGELIGFTLTLAGIAGAIVSIGITADSFIVYFERVRDEAREGRTIRSAVESGWARARHTIIIADVVSLLAAFILYQFAAGGVRGFAVALGITTLIDLLVVFLFTKPLVSLLARLNFFSSGHPASGFSEKSIGLKKAIATESVEG